MAHQQDSGVYVHGDFSEPMSAQHNFNAQHNMEDPQAAAYNYARTMHAHTRQQLDMAHNSARRRSQGSGTSSLSPQSSISSNDSVGVPDR